MQHLEISDLIPQQKPFVMIDELTAFEEGLFTTVFKISEDNIFVEQGLFQAEGIIENIAQTAAAGAGYHFKISNEEVKLGFIGALKNVIIYKLPPINSKISTTVQIMSRVWNVDIIEGKVVNENRELIAQCEMKIFIDNSDEKANKI